MSPEMVILCDKLAEETENQIRNPSYRPHSPDSDDDYDPGHFPHWPPDDDDPDWMAGY